MSALSEALQKLIAQYSGSSAGTTATNDWSALYDQMIANSTSSLNSQYAAQKAQYEAQLPQIKQAYDTTRNQTYTNARVNALGNNESLASIGLAGNAYAAPRSGYSETSRIAETNALRNALNAANLQQRTAEGDVQSGITQAGLSRDAAVADTATNINAQKASALQNQSQYDASLLSQLLSQQGTLEQREYQKQQDALDLAYKELSAFGKITTQAAADAIGFPIGTTYASMAGKQTSGGSNSSRSSSYKTISQWAQNNPDSAKGYLEGMVDSGYIKPEEAAYIWQVELGNTIASTSTGVDKKKAAADLASALKKALGK